MLRIILASKSPRRKKLLSQLGLDFEVIPSGANEEINIKNPVNFVEELAHIKARDVATNYPNSFIIGADTIVTHSENILGKPKNEQEAFDMLKNLSNSYHEVYTGIAFVKTNDDGLISAEKKFHQQTKVYFSALSNQEIKSYIETGSPFDKAGAYGIQDDMGAVFVERIEGDYYNVVGFPLNKFYHELKKFEPALAQLAFND